MKPTPLLAVAYFAAVAYFTPAIHAQGVTVYKGWCDASAAVALGVDHFVVANDEHNILQIYRRGQPDLVGFVDVSKFLGADKESDLEGAATIGNRVYWISSHGRNSRAKIQERRYRLFATEIQRGQTPSVSPVGRPYAGLLEDLVSADSLKAYGLAAAATLAPEAAGGLNIEGLAATPDGKLLVGFRNPITITRKLALVVPIENPQNVVTGAKAQLGQPIELDLGGRGIRSIELVGSRYLIVAGPANDKGNFVLYRWSGNKAEAPTVVAGIDFGKYKDFRPEALFAVPNSSFVQILSDDGGVMQNNISCKDMDESRQSFRSITLDLGAK